MGQYSETVHRECYNPGLKPTYFTWFIIGDSSDDLTCAAPYRIRSYDLMA